MKTILTAGRDFIINSTTVSIFIDKKPDYIDDTKTLSNHKGSVQTITWYEDEYTEGYPNGNAKKLTISPEDVKKLYNAIMEIESQKTVEQYCPDYF